MTRPARRALAAWMVTAMAAGALLWRRPRPERRPSPVATGAWSRRARSGSIPASCSGYSTRSSRLARLAPPQGSATGTASRRPPAAWRPAHRPPDAARADLPGRQRDQAVCRHRGAAAGRGGPPVAVGHRPALAAGHPALRGPGHHPPAAQPHQRRARLHAGAAGAAVHLPTWTVPGLEAAGAGRPDRRPAAGLPTRHGLVILQHRLHPGRPDRAGRHRPQAGPGAGPAHLPAAWAARHLLLGQPPNHPGAERARLQHRPVRPTARPVTGLRRLQPVAGVGGGRTGVQPCRPGALFRGCWVAGCSRPGCWRR